MELQYQTLYFLKKFGAIPSAEVVSKYIIGSIAEPEPRHDNYTLPPFGDRPIRYRGVRPNGWVRSFSGNLRVEYATGIIYSGFTPIYGSTDGLHENNPNMPPTKPFAMFRQRCRQVEEAILLKSLFQVAYYHFMFEVVPKLEIVDRAGIASDVPVIVTEDLASRKFFIDAKALGLFGARPLIIQNEDEVIRAKRLYVARADAYTANQLSFPMKRLAQPPSPRDRDRLYVTRSSQLLNGRHIINEADLVPRLRQFGFSVIDPGTLSLSEQIARFSRASIVVGPHGSGLTNTLFRYGAPMALVEMINHTKKWDNAHFQISVHCGYFYRATLNQTVPGHQKTAPAYADIDAVLAAVDESIAWEAGVYGEAAPRSRAARADALGTSS
jgi:hypothetical protein